ncbi:MAG: hypothetical protein RLP44_32985, partial [Aggregatilineales bacterium]
DSEEMTQMIGIARRLTQADFSVASRKRLTQKARLGQPNINSGYRMSRWLKIVAGIVFISLMVVSVPPLRNLAQDILARIGGVTITNAPTGVELRLTSTPDAQARVDATQVNVSRYSVEQANEQSQFQVLSLPSIPADYQLSWRNADYDVTAGIHSSDTNYSYMTTCEGGTSCLKFFWIFQTQYDAGVAPLEFQINVGEADVFDIAVRGADGIAIGGALHGFRQAPITDARPAGVGEIVPEAYNRILWVEGDTQFMMMSNSLSVDELIALAESLQ